jgi:hypothetical protein
MKIWVCLFLTILTLAVGCAPGYYDRRPAYPAAGATMNWVQNPETEEEYQMRLWSEEAHGH